MEVMAESRAEKRRLVSSQESGQLERADASPALGLEVLWTSFPIIGHHQTWTKLPCRVNPARGGPPEVFIGTWSSLKVPDNHKTIRMLMTRMRGRTTAQPDQHR